MLSMQERNKLSPSLVNSFCNPFRHAAAWRATLLRAQAALARWLNGGHGSNDKSDAA